MVVQIFKYKYYGDFPGGLVAKTCYSQCRRPGFDPLLGNSPPAASKTQHRQILKNKYTLKDLNNM